jgi:precorrin-3B C17-methyltransferase
MAKRLNEACKFFPCHKGLEDCTFCYCPFYPCGNKKLGKHVRSGKKVIWSCETCIWIHKKKVVDNIFKLIRKNSSPG